MTTYNSRERPRAVVVGAEYAPRLVAAVEKLAVVRDALRVPDATSHSFRKTVAAPIDDEGLSARIGADHLGHSRVTHDPGQIHGTGPLAYRCR